MPSKRKTDRKVVRKGGTGASAVRERKIRGVVCDRNGRRKNRVFTDRKRNQKTVEARGKKVGKERGSEVM